MAPAVAAQPLARSLAAQVASAGRDWFSELFHSRLQQNIIYMQAKEAVMDSDATRLLLFIMMLMIRCQVLDWMNGPKLLPPSKKKSVTAL